LIHKTIQGCFQILNAALLDKIIYTLPFRLKPFETGFV
jgi:hypothetical protein